MRMGRPALTCDQVSGPGFNADTRLPDPDGALTSTLIKLIDSPPRDFGRKDLASLNLLCATTLPGSEELDLSKCLARLDRLTAFVKGATDRSLHRFPLHPDYGHCEPMWRMALLVTLVKRDFGAAYNPEIIRDTGKTLSTPLSNSRDLFIHGLLDDNSKRRWGTCASIPVLIASVARRLGYPVGLATAGRHIYARWEGGGACFDIEASNPMGMTIPSEQELRGKISLSAPGLEASPYYLRTLFPVEEFALFLTLRVESLVLAARYDETLLWSARALQLGPNDPQFPNIAYQALDLAMKHRLWRSDPQKKIPPPDDPNPFYFDVGYLLRPDERSLLLTITAHYKESQGELAEARKLYEDACRQNFHGIHEQCDLQRFLRKHGVPRRLDPPRPPTNLGLPRRFKLLCAEHEEAAALRRLADQFQRRGELLKARDALHDLYMFDPSDAEIFQRARSIEQHPLFQIQLKSLFRESCQDPGTFTKQFFVRH